MYLAIFLINMLKIQVPDVGTVLVDNPKGETNHHLSFHIMPSTLVIES